MAGTYRKRGKKYLLEYMKDGIRYNETIEATNDKQAKIKLAEFVTKINKGNYYNTDYTFTEFAQMWIDEIHRPNSSPLTIDKYISYLNNRIIPYIGHYKLKNLSVPILTGFFNDAKKFQTLTKNPKPISKGTLEKIVEIVTAIMQKAYEWEMIENNPCKRIKVKYDVTLSSNMYPGSEDAKWYLGNNEERMVESKRHNRNKCCFCYQRKNTGIERR